MREVQGDRFQANWKYFSLEQVNNKAGPEWRLWDQAEDYPSRSIPAFLAAEAARRQGPEAYERMHFALLEGRHERRKDFTDPADIDEIARTAGLDMPRFKKDIADRSMLKRVADEHLHAVAQYGAFGTPTFAFDNGRTFFMRIKAPEDAQESARVFDALIALFVDIPNLDEVKRPRKPKA